MLLGFQKRWAPFVSDGSKTHTIRANSKRRPFRVGDSCDCYVDPRQKTMRHLGSWPCVKVEKIQIFAMPNAESQKYPLIIRIDDQPLSKDETEAFLFRDGFRSSEHATHSREAYLFWKKRLPFTGQIIHWRYSR